MTRSAAQLVTGSRQAIRSSTASRRRVIYEPRRDASSMDGGRIVDCGPGARRSCGGCRRARAVTHYANALITAGLRRLLTSTTRSCRSSAPAASRCSTGSSGYTFAAEERFADADYARSRGARLPAREPAQRHHDAPPCSARCTRRRRDVLFEEAAALDLRLIAGKVLMDRNAPAALLDTAQRGYDESQGADRALARQGPPRLRDHAALRGDVDAWRSSMPPAR